MIYATKEHVHLIEFPFYIRRNDGKPLPSDSGDPGHRTMAATAPYLLALRHPARQAPSVATATSLAVAARSPNHSL
jgi:hypothetical protein